MKTLPLPKFYRYLIYRLYTWRTKEKDDTPIATIVFAMTAVHCVHVLIIMAILRKVFPAIEFPERKKVLLIGVFFLLSLLYYLLIYNKERWLRYIEEFQGETPKQKKRRGVLVWLFTTGSIILFFVVIPILYWPK